MHNATEDSVLFVEVWRVLKANKELRAVCVGSRIGHGENTLVRVRIPDSLVVEFLSINALSTCAIAGSGVATLDHEAFDQSVELVALKVARSALFASAQSSEVFSCNRHIVVEQFDNHAAMLFFFNCFWAFHLDIEIHLRVVRVKIGQLVVNLCHYCRRFLFVDSLIEE